MTAKAMTAVKKTPSWQLRARRVQAHLVKLAARAASRYSPEQRRRFAPFQLSPYARGALQRLAYERMPTPPDGKTQLQRERLARMMAIHERISRLPLWSDTAGRLRPKRTPRKY